MYKIVKIVAYFVIGICVVTLSDRRKQNVGTISNTISINKDDMIGRMSVYIFAFLWHGNIIIAIHHRMH